MENLDIRKALKDNDIKQWELAEILGISEASIYRKLRTELPPDEKECMLKAIDDAHKQKVYDNIKIKDNMKIKLDTGAKMPTRAYPTDAGLDLYARESQTVPGRGCAIFDTGVHVELPKGTTGFVKSKSGLNVKHGLVGEGVIDESYSGSIVVKLYNHSIKSYNVNEGDKIAQLVILPCLTPELEQVDELVESGRGNNGFGSSGR